MAQNYFETVVPALVPSYGNETLGKDHPVRKYGEEFLITAIRLTPDGPEVVTNRDVLEAGLTPEEVIDAALRSMPAPVLSPLGDMVGMSDGSGAYVLTNRFTMFGAAEILNPAAMRELAEKMGGRDFYMIPSSIHEWIAIPMGEDDQLAIFSAMVSSVNEEQVALCEQLSDHAFIWDVASGTLISAERKEVDA